MDHTTRTFGDSLQLMALAAARLIVCHVKPNKAVGQRNEMVPVQKVRLTDTGGITTDSGKILLQPRVCTLRSYGSDPFGVVKTREGDGGGGDDVSRFFGILSEYIESSKKSQDFEIISGRLAMMVFAGTVTMEVVTGNSLFRKTDLQGIAEAAGVCLGAVACAAAFAWFSSARNRVDGIFSVRCNTFINSLIDQVVDGMFYDIDPTDWSDDL